MTSQTAPRHNLNAVMDRFMVYGRFRSAVPYGSGHINDTYAVVMDQAGTPVRYIAQRINTKIFRDPVGLMDNINRATAHLGAKLAEDSEAARRTLTLVPARDGLPYAQEPVGDFWRVYLFIEKARTYDAIESECQAFEAARAFGQFQAQLTDLPGPRLIETIPHFHDTPTRYQALLDAIQRDACNRACGIRNEIEFFLARERDTTVLLDLRRQGLVPERITHNDTKLNNVMLDDVTGEGLCVIDLDTVMPGLALYDFGDMVRTATSPAKEDERDLSQVRMQMNMFTALAGGYLESAGAFLTPAEIEHLPFSGKLITLEIGMRFLTDYLDGDVYFKTQREGHNLDRCRTQCRLVESIEAQMEEMTRTVACLSGGVLAMSQLRRERKSGSSIL